MTNSLKDAGTPVADAVPSEGATGWADSWMLSTKTKHPNCAYKFMAYVSTPKVQAQQGIYFGETPVNTKACAEMDSTAGRLLREVPPRRPGDLPEEHQVLEDAAAAMRGRQQDLHELYRLAAEVAGDQGLTTLLPGSGRRDAAVRDRRRLRRPVAETAGRARGDAAPAAGLVRAHLPRGARRSSSSRPSGASTRSRATSTAPGRSTISG